MIDNFLYMVAMIGATCLLLCIAMLLDKLIGKWLD